MKLRLRRPDDWHLHLRDGALLAAVLPHSAARFARAVVMPNLSPPTPIASGFSPPCPRACDSSP
jgi:dihydroorotase